MTTEERAAYAAAKTARERAEQGLPPKLTAAQHRAEAGILADAPQRKEPNCIRYLSYRPE